MKPLQPLRLSAVITFGLVATLAMSAGLAWKDRTRLVNEIERLRWQAEYPVHPTVPPEGFTSEHQLVDSGNQSARLPAG